MKPRVRRAGAFAATFAFVVACVGPPEAPSSGAYTLEFPSTAAAVATNTVQLFVFENLDPATKGNFCAEVISRQRRSEPLQASLRGPPVDICSLLEGQGAVTLPYGEVAILAVGERFGKDFLYGCTVQTIGKGDAPVPIALSLASVANPVPPTSCANLGDVCRHACQ